MDANNCLLRLLEAQRTRSFRAGFTLLATVLFLALPPGYVCLLQNSRRTVAPSPTASVGNSAPSLYTGFLGDLNAAGRLYPNSRTAVHLTSSAGKAGIESSGMLRGPSSAWFLQAGRVPSSTPGRVLKSLVRPSRVSDTVYVNAAGLVPQRVRSPLSLYQRAVGVMRTPGPGTYNIRTGQFFANQLYDDATGLLRPMTRWERFSGGVGHDLVLDGAIGWGGTIVVGGWLGAEGYTYYANSSQ